MILQKKLTGIKERELLYHMITGLKLVQKNLKKYPNEIQLQNVTFDFSGKEIIDSKGKLHFFIGFEKSKSKIYSESSSSTYSFNKMKSIKYQPSNYDWKEKGINLQLDFAGYIIRKIADEVLVSRDTGVPVSMITIEKGYSITKSKNGTLQFKFLGNLVDISANQKKAKTITNKFKIIFKLDDSKH